MVEYILRHCRNVISEEEQISDPLISDRHQRLSIMNENCIEELASLLSIETEKI